MINDDFRFVILLKNGRYLSPSCGSVSSKYNAWKTHTIILAERKISYERLEGAKVVPWTN